MEPVYNLLIPLLILNMEPPKLNTGNWITIGHWHCIVSKIYAEESRDALGLGEVVYNPEKPTTRDFDWDGEKYFFPDRGDFGGYAERTQPGYVRELRASLGWSPAGKRKRH